MSNLLTILTVRTNSERLKNKCLAPVARQPLLGHLLNRLRSLPGKLVVATTTEPGDDAIEAVCVQKMVECYRHSGPVDDVVGRMAAVVRNNMTATQILRALADCPFVEPGLITRAVHMLDKTGRDFMTWYTQPDVYPVYGSSELPISAKLFSMIDQCARGEEREHPALWPNRNRDRLKILYHEPPESVYFRPYLRLEVDWPEDLELVRAVAERGPGMTASLKEVIRWLDHNDWAARLNRGRVEKTGPSVSYSSDLRHQWFKLMKGQPVYRWDGGTWEPGENEDSPIFCGSGQCLVGWGLRRQGTIKTIEGHLVNGSTWLTCKCGAGKFTRERF